MSNIRAFSPNGITAGGIISPSKAGWGIALALGLASFGISDRAQAADYLRGAYAGERTPESAGVDWAGFYAGVHVGVTSAAADGAALKTSLVNAAAPPAIISPTVSSMFNLKPGTGASYGGFVGINWLWDDVVLGLEADYTHSGIRTGSLRTSNATFSNGTTYAVALTTDTRMRVADWGTVRGRIGWAAGMFMPYVTGGLAFGNFDTRMSLNGSYTINGVAPAPSTFAGTTGRTGFTIGAALGGGVDMQLIPNTFLRAEWQTVQFSSGDKRPAILINTARIAGGVKF
jgi:outer membrane immunogenic protein